MKKRWAVIVLGVMLLGACTKPATNTQSTDKSKTQQQQPGAGKPGDGGQPAPDKQQAAMDAPKAAEGSPVPIDINVTDEMLLNAGKQAQNWLTYHGNYEGTRYWPSDLINKDTVKKLVPKYIVQTGIVDGFETQPIVYDGVMYITTSNGPKVMAVDAKTGKKFWEYTWPFPAGVQLCCGPVNRGVALGGNQLFFTTLDAHLVALDAKSGKVNWAVAVGDPKKAESETIAPLYYKGKLIIGISGAEYGVSGWIQAFDPKDGKSLWKFDTINPKAGWPAADAASHGGGSTWVTGTIDPETETLYWGIGNPSPDFDGTVREGKNGYTESEVALDVNTGKLKWWYQMTPHDVYDYDGINTPAQLTVNINGKPTKVLTHADRDGNFYVLDRTASIAGKTDSQVDSSDFRLISKTPFVDIKNTGAKPTPEGVEVCPGPSGGSEWVAPSYDLKAGLAFASGINNCAVFKSHAWNFTQGKAYWGSAFTPLVDQSSGTFTAVDLATGKVKWQYKAEAPMVGGALTTAGGVTFTGEQNGVFEAFDNESGKILWQFQTGAGIHAQSSAFMIDGKPYVAVAAGDGGWVAGFGAVGTPNHKSSGGQLGDTLYVFGLAD